MRDVKQSRKASQKAWRTRKRMAEAREHIALTGGVGNPGGVTTIQATLEQVLVELRHMRKRLDEVYMEVLS